uniref:UV-stimulated scaffold protein A C-terminal domain-containing protein n=1 Tax=Populus davidiana TaxID=266767 RepID=A0A6M2EC70_9ROSI
MEMEEDAGKVRALIEQATNSTAAHVDPRLLKGIKTVVRYSDSELRLAAQILMEFMKRDHSQVRYLTLLIIDELFMRSKLFRALVVENLDKLLSLSVGFRRNHPLPAPPAVASVLRLKAIEFLEKWNSSFGIHYRQIRLGFDYLKNTLRFQFPNVQANAARVQQERREREMRTKEISANKFEALKENLSSLKEEIRETVDEIGECLQIVKNNEENVVIGALDDDEDFEEFHPLELRQLRLDSLKEGEKVCENSENKVVFDALRELYKLLVTKHLVSVQEGISILIRVEVEDLRLRDSILKEFIDIRNHLQSMKKKCVVSGCVLPDITKHDKEEEEDFWEEGKVESTDPGSFSEPNKQNENSAAPSTSGEVKNDPSECSTKKMKRDEFLCSEGGGTDSSSLRSKLMTVAPVIEWGSFLDTWGSNRDVLANHRGLELESHWGRVDHDAVIPAKKIAELNLHATLYKEDRVEIQPCRAPLGKGGLCQRRDLRVCPFHGPIIPRDDEGNPINQGTSTSDLSLDLGTGLVEQLAEQAVKNVRDRDNKEARKRKMDKQSQKRAKLAKIREHNEAVLRDASVASTSRSSVYGDNVEASSRDRLLARNKKDTLASMLRKKVTTKDRLSQRLLNTRASDAMTRQLKLGEDANYREAFPNLKILMLARDG